MLVISRKVGESIFVGNAQVKIVSIKGGRIKVGVVAPANIKVLREELVGVPPKEPQKEEEGPGHVA